MMVFRYYAHIRIKQTAVRSLAAVVNIRLSWELAKIIVCTGVNLISNGTVPIRSTFFKFATVSL